MEKKRKKIIIISVMSISTVTTSCRIRIRRGIYLYLWEEISKAIITSLGEKKNLLKPLQSYTHTHIGMYIILYLRGDDNKERIYYFLCLEVVKNTHTYIYI